MLSTLSQLNYLQLVDKDNAYTKMFVIRENFHFQNMRAFVCKEKILRYTTTIYFIEFHNLSEMSGIPFSCF